MDCIKNYIFESDDKEEEQVTIRKEEQEDLEIIHKPKIIYNCKYNFSEYRNVGKYMNDSLELKYNRLPKFYNQLNEFKKITSQTLNRKEKKKTVHNIANPLTIDCNDYINPDKLKEKMGEYYNPGNLLIQVYRFIE